jgi:hypothetical protein
VDKRKSMRIGRVLIVLHLEIAKPIVVGCNDNFGILILLASGKKL